MERLSDFAADIINDLYENSDWYGDYSLIETAINRLAAYEETGLEPEEIEQLKGEAFGLRLGKWEEGELEQYRALGPIDRLRELKQADDEGRCVVLPCNVGDKIYDIILGELREKSVISLSMLLSKSVNHLVVHAENFRNAVTSYELQDIGKTVFLTRAEAQAALRREQDG